MISRAKQYLKTLQVRCYHATSHGCKFKRLQLQMLLDRFNQSSSNMRPHQTLFDSNSLEIRKGSENTTVRWCTVALGRYWIFLKTLVKATFLFLAWCFWIDVIVCESLGIHLLNCLPAALECEHSMLLKWGLQYFTQFFISVCKTLHDLPLQTAQSSCFFVEDSIFWYEQWNLHNLNTAWSHCWQVLLSFGLNMLIIFAGKFLIKENLSPMSFSLLGLHVGSVKFQNRLLNSCLRVLRNCWWNAPCENFDSGVYLNCLYRFNLRNEKWIMQATS